MEEDPSFKQLIPYVLFRWTDDKGTIHVFQYQRGGGMGEARLHAKFSVGVGGHISSDDVETSNNARKGGAGNDSPHAHHIYRSGMQRELAEEVAIDTAYDETVVGLINDDETPVGRVHLGVVHLCDVAEPRVTPREADVLNAGFQPVNEILQRLDQFETWSQIAIRASSTKCWFVQTPAAVPFQMDISTYSIAEQINDIHIGRPHVVILGGERAFRPVQTVTGVAVFSR